MPPPAATAAPAPSRPRGHPRRGAIRSSLQTPRKVLPGPRPTSLPLHSPGRRHRDCDEEELAEKCEQAIEEERDHLRRVRGWVARGQGRG